METKQAEMPNKLEKFNPLQSEIAQIKEDCTNLIATDTKTYQGVRKSRTRVQKTITTIKTIEADLKRPALDFLDKVRTTSRELQGELEPIKDELIEEIKRWDKGVEERRIEREKKEQERKAKIELAITTFKSNTDWRGCETRDDLDSITTYLEEFLPDKKVFQEYLPSIELDIKLAHDGIALKLKEIEEKEELILQASLKRIHELTGENYDGDLEAIPELLEELEEAERMRIAEANAKKDLENVALDAAIKNVPSPSAPSVAPSKEETPKDLPTAPGVKPEPLVCENSLTDSDKAIMRIQLDLINKIAKGPTDSYSEAGKAIMVKLRDDIIELTTKVREGL